MTLNSLRSTPTFTCRSRQSFVPQYPRSMFQMKSIKNGTPRASALVSPSVLTAKPPSLPLPQKNSGGGHQRFNQSGPVDTEVLKLRTPHSGFHLGDSDRDYMEGWYWRVCFCSATLPCLRLARNPVSKHSSLQRFLMYKRVPSYDNTKTYTACFMALCCCSIVLFTSSFSSLNGRWTVIRVL